MAKYSEYGIQAERLFVTEAKGPEEIAATLRKVYGGGAPSERTIERWAITYRWNERRKTYRQSPQGALANLEETLSLVCARLRELVSNPSPDVSEMNKELSRASDFVSKLTKSILSIKKGMDFRAAVLMVFSKFSDYILENEKDEATRERLIGHIQGFSNRVESE